MYLLAGFMSLEINVYSILLLIFNQFFWQSNCMHFFVYLDMNSLSDVLFANIFSHLVGCIFILSMGLFTLKKFLVVSVPFVYFFFERLYFWCQIKLKKIITQTNGKELFVSFIP